MPQEDQDDVQFESTIKRLLGIDPDVQLPGAEPVLPRLESPDRYTVVAEIAEGGMGKILKVYDHNLKRCVAMKVVLKRGEGDRYAFQKFVEEAQVNAQLEHPNIVPTYDIGIDREGNLYFTMRMVHGRSLREIIRGLQEEVPETAGEFTLLKRLQVFLQAANAIGYAHSKGVVHRDIKPDNIMVGRFGEVFVMDWGLAKILGRAGEAKSGADTFVRIDPRADVTKTVEGTIAGTPYYMAPEQALGKIEEIDPRTDIYALGAVLFELITLSKPVEGEDADEVIVNVARGRLRPVPATVPRELAAIMRKALAFRREDRYPSVPDLVADIQAYLEGRRGSAWQDNALTLAIKWVRRHAAVSAVTVGALAVLLGYMIYTWTRPGRLQLESVPAGARVWVDGEEVGNTPLSRPLSPGRHMVRLSMRGYDDSVQEIHLRAGSTSEHRFVLNSVSQVVSVVSDPAGAEFEIFGSAAQSLCRGTTPQAVLLPRGTYRIVISKLGYVMAERTITVRGGGGLLPLEPVTLEKNMGTLRIDSYQEGVIATILRRGQPDPVRTVTLPLHDPLELPTGAYEIEFAHDQGYPVVRTVLVEKDKEARLGVYLPPAVLWEFRPNGAIYSPPALADVDGDGTIDAVLNTMDGGVSSLTAISGRNGLRLWSVKVGSRGHCSAVACADLNGDGCSDVVFGSQEKFVGALNGRDGSSLWECPTNGEIDQPVALADLNGDGVEDAVAVSRASVVYAINGKDGTIQWEFGSQIRLIAAPALADLTGDGTADVALVTADARVIVLDGASGRIDWQLQLPGPPRSRPAALTDPVLGDLNGDGVPEIVVASPHSGRLFAVNGRGGGTLWEIEIMATERQTPALTDVNGDRVPDVLLVFENRSIAVLSGRDGATLWMQNVGFPITSPLSVGDMNQDGVPDVVFCRGDGRLQSLSGRSGEPLAQFKVKGAVAAFMAPAIADVNRDGAPDIVLCDFTRCTVFAGRTDRVVSFVAGEGGGTCASTLEDVTGDGTPELVFAAPGLLRVVSLEQEKVVDVKTRTLARPFGYSVKPLGDADGDGKPDVLVISERAIHLISGREGMELWRLEIEESNFPALRYGDLNGDKVLDVIMLRGRGRLAAYSGLDGRPLWMREGLTGTDAQVMDLNGDRRADVLAQADGQRLVALSGASGELLWTAEAGDRVLSFFEYGADVVVTTRTRIRVLEGSTGALVREFAGTQEHLRCAGVDLDGDGVLDLTSVPEYGSVVYCYSGKNGNRLFGTSLTGMLVAGPVFGDPDGDGRLKAVVLTTVSAASWEALKLVVLSARDGSLLWEAALDSADALSLLNARLALVGKKIVVSTGSRVSVFSAPVRPDSWVWQADGGPNFRRTRAGP